MIKTTAILSEELCDYAAPGDKLTRMVRNGDLQPIVKGLYETKRDVSACFLASSIYGPSYISFEYALSFYGLIPEAVYAITCATFEKKKKKRYDTAFGVFTYQDIPSDAFPLGQRLEENGDYAYWIASPEKALCDLLYTFSPVSNTKELRRLLTEDLRMESSAISNLCKEDIAGFVGAYHSTNVKLLSSLLRRWKE